MCHLEYTNVMFVWINSFWTQRLYYFISLSCLSYKNVTIQANPYHVHNFQAWSLDFPVHSNRILHCIRIHFHGWYCDKMVSFIIQIARHSFRIVKDGLQWYDVLLEVIKTLLCFCSMRMLRLVTIYTFCMQDTRLGSRPGDRFLGHWIRACCCFCWHGMVIF